MELENILDEQDIHNQENTGLKLELKKMAWWSQIMSTLAIIGSIIFAIFALWGPLSSRYIDRKVFWLFSSLLIASIIIIVFAISVLLVAKKANKYIWSDAESDLETIIKKNRLSWLLGAFVFLLMGLPPASIAARELYKEYSYSSYSFDNTPSTEEAVSEQPLPSPTEEVVFPEN